MVGKRSSLGYILPSTTAGYTIKELLVNYIVEEIITDLIEGYRDETHNLTYLLEMRSGSHFYKCVYFFRI